MYSSYGSQKEEYGFGQEYRNTNDDYYRDRDRKRDHDRDRHRYSPNHINRSSSSSRHRDRGLERNRRRSPPSRPSENCDSAGTGHLGQGSASSATVDNKSIFNDYERKPTFSSLNIKRTLDPDEIKVAELRKRLQNSTPYLQKLLKHFHDRGMDRVREEEINDINYYLTLGKEVKYDSNHAECLDDALTQIINLSRKYPISMNDASEEEENSSGSDSDGDKKDNFVPTESKNNESENRIPLTALERHQQQHQLDQQRQSQTLPGSPDPGPPDHNNYNDAVRTVPKKLGENSGFGSDSDSDSDSDVNKSEGDGSRPGPEFLRNPFNSRQFLASSLSSNNHHDNINSSDSDSSDNNNVKDPWGSPVINAKRKTSKAGQEGQKQDQLSKNYSSLASSTLRNNSNNYDNFNNTSSSCVPPGLRPGAGRGRGIRAVNNMSDSNIGLNITNPNSNNTRDNRMDKKKNQDKKNDTSPTGPPSKPAPNYTDWEGNMKTEGKIRSSASPPTATCDSSRDRDRSMDRDRNRSRSRDLPLSPQVKDVRRSGLPSSNSPDSTTFNTCATQLGISSSSIAERRGSLSDNVIANTSTSTSTFDYCHGKIQENNGNVAGRQMWGSSSSSRPRSRSGSRSSSSSSSRSPSPRGQFDPADFEFDRKARSTSNLQPSQGQAKSQSGPVEEEPIRFDYGHGQNNNESTGQSRIGIHEKYGYLNPLADVHLRAQQQLQLGSQATTTRTENQIQPTQPLPLVQPQPQDILPNPLFNYGHDHDNSMTSISGPAQGQVTNTSQQNQQQQYMHSMMQPQFPQSLTSSIMPKPTPAQSQFPFQPQQQIMFQHAQQQQQQQNHQFQMPMPVQPGLGNLNPNQQMMYQMAQGQSYYQNQIQNPVTTMGIGVPQIRPGVPQYYLTPQQQQQQQQQMMMAPTPPAAFPQLQDPRQQSASLNHAPNPAVSTYEMMSNDNNSNFGYEQQPQVSADPRLRAQNQTPSRNHVPCSLVPSPILQSPPSTSTWAVNNSQLNSNNIAVPRRPEEISLEMLQEKARSHFGARPRAHHPPQRPNTSFNYRPTNPNFNQNNNRSRYFFPNNQNNNANRAPLGNRPGQAPRFRQPNPLYQNRLSVNRNFNRESQNLPRAPAPAAPSATTAFDEDLNDNNLANDFPSDKASTATGSGGPSKSNAAPEKPTSSTAATPARKNNTNNSTVTQKSTYKDRIISRLQDVMADSMNAGDKGRPGSGSKLKQLRENLSKSGYYSLGQGGPRTQKIFEEAPLPSLAIGGKGGSTSQKDKTKGAPPNIAVGDQILEDNEPNSNSGSEDASVPAPVKNKNSKNRKAKTSKDKLDEEVSKTRTAAKKKGGPKVKLPFSKNTQQPLKKNTGRSKKRVISSFEDDYDDDESNSNNAGNNFEGEASNTNTNTEIPELDSSSEEEIPSEIPGIVRAFLEDDDMSAEDIQDILDNPASVREIYRLFKIEMARSCVNLSSVPNKSNKNPPATTSAHTGSDLDSEIIDAGRKAVSPLRVEDGDPQDNNVFPGRVLRSDSRKNTPTKNSKCSSSHMNPVVRLETLKFIEQSLLNEGTEKTASSSKLISISKKRKLTGARTKSKKRHDSDAGSSKQPKPSKRGRKSVAVSAMVAAAGAAMTSVSSSTSGPSSSEDNSESSELDSSFQASLQAVAAAVQTKANRKSLRNKNPPAPSAAPGDNLLMPPPPPLPPPYNNADAVDQILALHQPLIPVNTGFTKVKIESDYIPITTHVKMEAE